MDGCGEHFVFPTSAPTRHLGKDFVFSTSRLEKTSSFPHSPPPSYCCCLNEREKTREDSCPGGLREQFVSHSDVRGRQSRHLRLGCPGLPIQVAPSDVRGYLNQWSRTQMSGVANPGNSLRCPVPNFGHRHCPGEQWVRVLSADRADTQQSSNDSRQMSGVTPTIRPIKQKQDYPAVAARRWGVWKRRSLFQAGSWKRRSLFQGGCGRARGEHAVFSTAVHDHRQPRHSPPPPRSDPTTRTPTNHSLTVALSFSVFRSPRWDRPARRLATRPESASAQA